MNLNRSIIESLQGKKANGKTKSRSTFIFHGSFNILFRRTFMNETQAHL